MRRDVFSIVVVSALIAPLAARQDIPVKPAQPLTAAATAVVVDVIVRDSRGNPVTDLRKEDFVLLENGVPQPIGDVTVVRGAPAAPPATGTDASTAAGATRRADAPPRGPTFLALVFDRLSLDARARAVKGALASLEDPRAMAALAAVQDQTPDGRTRRAARGAIARLRKVGERTQETARLSDDLESVRRKNADLLSRLEKVEARLGPVRAKRASKARARKPRPRKTRKRR